MKLSSSKVAIALTAALPFHLLLIIASGAGVLALLIYAGVVLPAVWSAKPARRKAAATVLHQILGMLQRQRQPEARRRGVVERGASSTSLQ